MSQEAPVEKTSFLRRFFRGVIFVFVVFLKWATTLAVCAGILAGLGYYKFIEIQKAIEKGKAYPEQSETVSSQEVTPVIYQPTLRVVGQVVSPQQVLLKNELPGRIVNINFRPGTTIRKGEIIMQIDVSEELAKIASVRAKATLGQITLKRMSRLQRENAASGASVDQAKADVGVALAEINAFKSIIEKKTIRAPFDGTLGIHQLEVGQYLQAGTNIASLVGITQSNWIEFRLPQSQSFLSVGSVVHVKSILNNNPSSAESPIAEARIIAKDTTIASESRSMLYRASIPKSSLSIAHNAVVEVIVPEQAAVQAFGVPSTAVRHDRFSKYVFLLKPDQEKPGAFRAEKRNVRVVGRKQDLAIVESGIKSGEMIAVSGSFKLSQGLLVYLENTNQNSWIEKK